MGIRAGDRVVVRSREEILASLEKSGELESMPFMMEMFQFCGRAFEVAAVAHKTCDTIHKTGGRKVANAVHLEGVRCDGSAHGSCQAGCLIFWKTEWLRRPDEPIDDRWSRPSPNRISAEELRVAGVQVLDDGVVYSCQATRLFDASNPLRWWDVGQYVADLRFRNVSIGRFLRVSALRALYGLRRLPIGYRISVAIYDSLHRWITGRPTPYATGVIADGQPTPAATLGLSTGEYVTVRPLEEIRQTVTESNLNRGMSFDPEMARFCGSRFRVDRRVERIIDERTGRMLHMKSPCIVLEGPFCSGEYSQLRLFCPRRIQPYFREIWLRRAPDELPENKTSGT